MIDRTFEVRNKLGLHARVAARLVRECRKFQCGVFAYKDGKSFDFKNVTGIITLNAKCGDVLSMTFDGEDEESAAAALGAMFENKFGED